eukprot:TRINITY_DN1544_c0_g1_i1.p1 TRINITY_DN1544_c0_g1~~TRINITY_DN1544_c0_g1_i1.p1  ORF type:complete len:142 (+),score=36.99 TRINITY_DN1544_c0_g1_i1:102-527(+)
MGSPSNTGDEFGSRSHTPATYDSSEDEGADTKSLKGQMKKKAGPRDIDMSTGAWKPAQYKVADDSADWLKEKVHKSRQMTERERRKQKRERRKMGPREIGRITANSTWTPAQYEMIDESKNFLAERLERKKKKVPTAWPLV